MTGVQTCALPILSISRLATSAIEDCEKRAGELKQTMISRAIALLRIDYPLTERTDLNRIIGRVHHF